MLVKVREEVGFYDPLRPRSHRRQACQQSDSRSAPRRTTRGCGAVRRARRRSVRVDATRVGSSIRETAPTSSRCRRRDGLGLHIALWRRDGGPNGRSPTQPLRCLPATRLPRTDTVDPAAAARRRPILITASANRRRCCGEACANRIDIQFVRIGSAGAKAMAVRARRRRRLPACRRSVGNLGFAAPAGVVAGRGSARVPPGRFGADLQPARPLPARPADVPPNLRSAASTDPVGVSAPLPE